MTRHPFNSKKQQLSDFSFVGQHVYPLGGEGGGKVGGWNNIPPPPRRFFFQSFEKILFTAMATLKFQKSTIL